MQQVNPQALWKQADAEKRKYYLQFISYVLKYYMLKPLQKRSDIMPRVCAVSGKKFMSGNHRSHSMHATRKLWKANLQKVRIVDENGQVKRVYVSARALKSGKVTRA